MANLKRILVPTDFSAPADEALDYALSLGRPFGAAVTLLHVFEDPFALSLYSEQYVPMPPEMRDEILDHIRARLAERVARSGRTDVTSIILTGPTAPTIAESAREQKADLIVMGTHGRHGVTHLLLGSVAERVVRTAPCPVLTVRGTGAERGVKAA
jgi:universal stress protein A